MVILGHFLKQKYNQLLEESIEVNDRYSKKQYGVDQELLVLLEKSESFFKHIGKRELESKVSSLRSYISTANSGIDPQTLETIPTFKRKIVKISIFYCNSQLGVILENELEKVNNLLTESENTTLKVILSLIQSGAVDIETLMSLESLDQISLFWESAISQNEQIGLIDIQLRQNILREDIFLLIQNIISKIKF